MAVRGGTAFIKILLVIFNFLLFACGLLLLICSFWIWIDNRKMLVSELYVMNTTYYNTVYILMGTGAFVTLLGILGCLGSGQESTGMLTAYFILLVVVLTVEVAVVTVIFSYQDGVIARLQNLYAYAYLKFLSTQMPSLRLTLIILHHVLDCCGLTGILDQIITNTCPARSGLDIFMVQSCPSAITAIFQRNGGAIQGVCIGLGVATILALVFTKVLQARIQRSREQPQQNTQPVLLNAAWQYSQQQSIPLIIETMPAEASPPPYEDDVESSKI